MLVGSLHTLLSIFTSATLTLSDHVSLPTVGVGRSRVSHANLILTDSALLSAARTQRPLRSWMASETNESITEVGPHRDQFVSHFLPRRSHSNSDSARLVLQ